MKKEQRQLWLDMFEEVSKSLPSGYGYNDDEWIPILCSFCRYSAFDYDYLTCEHPIEYVSDNADFLGLEGGNCWAFRPSKDTKTPEEGKRVFLAWTWEARARAECRDRGHVWKHKDPSPDFPLPTNWMICERCEDEDSLADIEAAAIASTN